MDVNCADLPLATKDDENGVDKPQNPVVSDTNLENNAVALPCGPMQVV